MLGIGKIRRTLIWFILYFCSIEETKISTGEDEEAGTSRKLPVKYLAVLELTAAGLSLKRSDAFYLHQRIHWQP